MAKIQWRKGIQDDRERYSSRATLLIETFDGEECFFVTTFDPWGRAYATEECITLKDAEMLFESECKRLVSLPII